MGAAAMAGGAADEDRAAELAAEARRFPLLSAAQERDLGARIHHGARVAKAWRALMWCAPGVLALSALDARDAHHALVQHNTRLVRALALKRLAGFERVGILDYEDLVALGNRGLLHAAWIFDYRRGYRFSTHATWWIRQAISRGVADESHAIRLPVYVDTAKYKIRRLTSQYRSEVGDSEATPPADWMEAHGLTKAQLRVYHEPPPAPPISLAMPVYSAGGHGGGPPMTIADALEDERPDGAPATLEAVEGRVDAARLVAFMRRHLTGRELAVLLARSGIHGEAPTLEELGRAWKVSRERIRQIEMYAKRKLRDAGLQPDGSIGAPVTGAAS